jgi:hypothetical protein
MGRECDNPTVNVICSWRLLAMTGRFRPGRFYRWVLIALLSLIVDNVAPPRAFESVSDGTLWRSAGALFEVSVID